MVKLLVYAYSYGIRSSRKLEGACHHNLSFIWLMGALTPDYPRIARFRDAHKESLKNILKESVRMCLKLNLIDGHSFFVDSTVIKANASLSKTKLIQRSDWLLLILRTSPANVVEQRIVFLPKISLLTTPNRMPISVLLP